MQDQNIVAVILAAGRGTRMQDPRPKVLVPVCGKPMLHWVLKATRAAGVQDSVLVLSENLQEFGGFLGKQENIQYVVQKKRNGTAGAIACTSPFFKVLKT